MRRVVPLVLIAVLVVGLLAGALVAFGSSDDDGSVSLDEAKVSGEGAAVAVDVGAGIKADDVEVRVLSEGDGRELAEGDYVRIDYVIASGSDGQTYASTFAGGIGEGLELTASPANPQSFPGLPEAMVNALTGLTTGSEVLIALPVLDFVDDPAAVGFEEDETLVFYMQLTDSSRVSATQAPEGEAAALPAGIPTPILDGNTVTGVDGSAAGEVALTRNVVIEGTGKEVQAGHAVVADYLGQVYPTGAVFDSSFARGEPAVFPLDGVIACWTEQLAGLKVGSRVVLTCPNDKAYGDQDRGDIKAGDALTFVVDIRDTF